MMTHVEEKDVLLMDVLRDGLAIVPRPYAELGAKTGMEEGEVIERLSRLIKNGIIRRFGAIVRHRTLGYTANAMVVFDINDEKVGAVAEKISALPFVTLCYRRPRRGAEWPYNLFCMIHGREREAVQKQISFLFEALDLEGTPHAVLFSRRAFKQCAARYTRDETKENTKRCEDAA